MDKIFERLPETITAAAQSYLGTFALLSIALSVLAYVFFAKAREKVKVGIFVLLFLGIVGFAFAMFRVSTVPLISSKQVTSAEPANSQTALSKEAKILLKGAAADQSGLVLFERYGASVDLHTNGTSLLTSKADHYVLALWESALQELVREGLFIDRGNNGEIYEITKKGYDAAKVED